MLLWGTVGLYAVARLAAMAASTPIALHAFTSLSHVFFERWTGGLGVAARDVPPVDPDTLGNDSNPASELDVLIASGTTGVPYPFGPALLARNGLAPDVSRWLFLSDLPAGHLVMSRLDESTYRLALSPRGISYDLRHGLLFPVVLDCNAMTGSTIERRDATFRVRRATDSGDPLDFDVTFRPGTTQRFWMADRGKLTRVSPPAVGQQTFY